MTTQSEDFTVKHRIRIRVELIDDEDKVRFSEAAVSRFYWSPEAADDMKALHGPDAMKGLIEALAEGVQKDLQVNGTIKKFVETGLRSLKLG